MNYPTPEPKEPLRCPWWPTCEAVLVPIPQLVRAGSEELLWVYPIHDVVGPGSWYGHCPASHFLITYLPEGGYRITDYAAGVLADQGQFYTKWLLERERAAKDRARKPPPPKRTVQDVITYLAGGDEPPPTEVERLLRTHGAHVDPRVTNADYFPGRPTDAGEPGAGDAPVAPVPAGVGGEPMTGRGAMADNSHSTTRGLAELAVNQMGQTQDLLARITNAIDEAEAISIAVQSQVRSVQGLVTACVGTGEGAPASGEQMAEQTMLAVDTIAGDNNILIALRVAKSRVEAAHQQINAAVEHGRTYIGVLSR